MSTERVPSEREVQSEADSFTGGPGVVATKSQARGGIAGAAVGALIGAIMGALIGLLFLGGGSSTIITAVVGAVAGAVALGVFGGIFNSAKNVTPTSPADN
jgi:uncharacterized membrane protein